MSGRQPQFTEQPLDLGVQTARGPAERSLARSVRLRREAGELLDVDEAAITAARLVARSLDTGSRTGASQRQIADVAHELREWYAALRLTPASRGATIVSDGIDFDHLFGTAQVGDAAQP